MRKCPGDMENRWDRIAELVDGKTKKECQSKAKVCCFQFEEQQLELMACVVRSQKIQQIIKDSKKDSA